MRMYRIRFTPLKCFTSKIFFTFLKSKLCFPVPTSDEKHKGIFIYHKSLANKDNNSFIHYHSSEACCAALYLFSNRFWDANTWRQKLFNENKVELTILFEVSLQLNSLCIIIIHINSNKQNNYKSKIVIERTQGNN